MPITELRVRQAAVVILGLIALVSATGFTQAHVFHQPSTLKYALTTAAPLGAGVLVISRRPLTIVTGAIIVVAPFAGFVFNLGGFRLQPLTVLFSLAALLWAVQSPRASARRSHLFTAGVFLVVMLVLPVLQASGRTGELSDLISVFGSALLVADVARTRSGFIAMAWSLVAMAGVQSIIAVYEKQTGHQLNLYGSAGAGTYTGSSYFFKYGSQTRPPGAFYDPISLGNSLAITIPVALGLAYESVRDRRWWRFTAAVAAIAVTGFALELTLSRMSWIGAGAGVLVTVLLLPGPGRRLLLPLILEALVILAVLGVFSGDSASVRRLSSVLHPLNETGTGNGDQIRVQIWGIALRTFEHHPIAGIGLQRLGNSLSGILASTTSQSNAQSTYLQAAAEGGVLLLAGLFAVLVAAVVDLRAVIGRDRVVGGVLAGCLITMLICWTTDVTIRYSAVAVIMGAVLGLIAGRARDLDPAFASRDLA